MRRPYQPSPGRRVRTHKRPRRKPALAAASNRLARAVCEESHARARLSRTRHGICYVPRACGVVAHPPAARREWVAGSVPTHGRQGSTSMRPQRPGAPDASGMAAGFLLLMHDPRLRRDRRADRLAAGSSAAAGAWPARRAAWCWGSIWCGCGGSVDGDPGERGGRGEACRAARTPVARALAAGGTAPRVARADPRLPALPGGRLGTRGMAAVRRSSGPCSG